MYNSLCYQLNLGLKFSFLTSTRSRIVYLASPCLHSLRSFRNMLRSVYDSWTCGGQKTKFHPRQNWSHSFLYILLNKEPFFHGVKTRNFFSWYEKKNAFEKSGFFPDFLRIASIWPEKCSFDFLSGVNFFLFLSAITEKTLNNVGNYWTMVFVNLYVQKTVGSILSRVKFSFMTQRVQ